MRLHERGILLQAAMSRAARGGTKTQTRRVCAGQRERSTAADFPVDRCPYGRPGDRLWVREAWKTLADWDAFSPALISPTAPIHYLADGEAPAIAGRYRHARFMPRWASRTLLEITDVRVERLQSISEADARAEGIVQHRDGHGWHVEDGRHYSASASNSYASLWEAINGAGSWDINPLVWAVTFKRVQPC